MAKSKNRVPQKVSDFFDYLENTSAYLLLTPPGAALVNWERLGLTGGQVTLWLGFLTTESSLKPKYTDKKVSRTTAVKDNVLKLIKEFTLFSRDPLNVIAGITTSTIDDLEKFHIKAKSLRDTEPSPIHSTAAPVVGLLNKGGGEIDFHVRSTTDQTRASMLRDYELEVRFKINGTAPTGFNEAGLPYHISSKAHFKIEAGGDNLGKIFYCYARWRHLHNREFDGPWTNLMQIFIA